MPKEVGPLLMPTVLHSPERARGDHTFRLLLLEGRCVGWGSHRKGRCGGLWSEVELSVLPGLECPDISWVFFVSHRWFLSSGGRTIGCHPGPKFAAMPRSWCHSAGDTGAGASEGTRR